MASLCKLDQITLRVLFSQELGVHVHGIEGDAEVVVGLTPIKLLQAEAPPEMVDKVLGWVREHERELRAEWDRHRSLQANHHNSGWHPS